MTTVKQKKDEIHFTILKTNIAQLFLFTPQSQKCWQEPCRF